jgi:hypothetical protein
MGGMVVEGIPGKWMEGRQISTDREEAKPMKEMLQKPT